MGSALGMAVLLAAPAFGGHAEVGVFLQKEAKCSVIQDGETISCEKSLGLISGDVIVTSRPPNRLKIQWLSKDVKLVKSSPDHYQVLFESPKEKRGLVRMALDIFGFAHDSSRVQASAVTRGGTIKTSVQLPGDFATLLPGKPTTFAWCDDKAERFLIRDKDGRIIFERSVDGVRSLALSPEEAGIKSGATYTGEVAGGVTSGNKVRLLDQETVNILNEGFATIDADGKLLEAEKVLAKASFALFLSDSYPEEVSLGWLAYDLIARKKETLTSQDRKTAGYLKDKSGIRRCGE